MGRLGGARLSDRDIKAQERGLKKRHIELTNKIKAAEGKLGSRFSDIALKNRLMSNKNLIAYLQDAEDFQITGKDKAGNEYNQEIAEEKRKQLKGLIDMDPKLATAETALLLDKIGYVSRMAKKRALEQQNKFVGIDNSLQNVLRAPQIDLLTPIGQVKNYIKEMDSGLYKNRLMAQFEAESNPEFGRLYNSVPERERVLFAIQPNMWERYQELSGEKEEEAVAYGARKGLLKGRNKAVKQAAKYVQTMTPAAFKALRPNKIIDAAEELFKTKNDQAAFLTEIGALQRLAKEGTAIKTPTIMDLILARAPEMQKKAEQQIDQQIQTNQLRDREIEKQRKTESALGLKGNKEIVESEIQIQRKKAHKNLKTTPAALKTEATPAALNTVAQKTHTVAKGQNLGRIAKKYNVSVKALKKANEMKSDKISIGTKLVIPTTEE
jgi:LysM repeat protein